MLGHLRAAVEMGSCPHKADGLMSSQITDLSIGCQESERTSSFYRWGNRPRELIWSVEDLLSLRTSEGFLFPYWLWNVLRFLPSSIVSLGTGGELQWLF